MNMTKPRNLALMLAALLGIIAGIVAPSAALAARSDVSTSPAVTARLITAEDGIAANTQGISAALSLKLGEGWKTYWRSPGEVGLPPEIDWSGSVNVQSAEFQYPAPTRFRAFGIENFGYEKQVTYPILITLAEPGKPAELRASVSLLVCSDICVPSNFDLALSLPGGAGIDQISAGEIAKWSARVPGDGRDTGISLRSAALSEDATSLVVELDKSTGWDDPDIFPELGEDTAFGTPDIRLSSDRATLWASLPILYLSDPADPLALTATDGNNAATLANVTISPVPAEPPFTVAAPGRSLALLGWVALLAFAGGIILNAMPCVLPVLSIKLSSALKLADGSPGRIRNGFLMTALGTLVFMWVLAAIVLALQAFGFAIGWGTQFQNPYFLVFLIVVLGLFAASLLGLFEFSLPAGLSTRLANSGGQGYLGDFATGTFAAILATPCSAPLLGTAVAFALTGSAYEVMIIFTSMGLGLALPYLIVAARPGMISALPRPGRWMLAVKLILGLLLAGTAAWLFWVLMGVSSARLALWVGVLLGLAILALGAGRWWRGRQLAGRFAPVSAVLLIAVALFLPSMVAIDDRAAITDERIDWVVFDRPEIPRLVSQGQVVFVDVTADWCLTCKANKTLVLERAPVVDALASASVVAMQADWTRPDPRIQAYLEANGRFGIPFNIVYGPAAPEGIPLSEVLTPTMVMEALETALGTPIELAENVAN